MTTPPLATRKKTPENTGQAGRAGMIAFRASQECITALAVIQSYAGCTRTDAIGMALMHLQKWIESQKNG